MERITFPDGNWWEVKPFMTRGDRRRVDKYVQREALGYVRDLQDQGLDMSTMRGMAGEPDDGPRQPSPDEDDALLLHCTVGWSWDEDVCQESIDSKPESVVNQVLARMHSLYYLTEEEDANLGGTPPS